MTYISTKSSTKKFHLVSKYDTYCIWDGQQNAPTHEIDIDSIYFSPKHSQRSFNEVSTKSKHTKDAPQYLRIIQTKS